MPDLPEPAAPDEQRRLRAHLEDSLSEWGIPYRHEDRFWELPGGLEAVYGWGTRIARGGRRRDIRVWFDGLDADIMMTMGRRYVEWRDLTDMDFVLADITETMQGMLSGSSSRRTPVEAFYSRPWAWFWTGLAAAVSGAIAFVGVTEVGLATGWAIAAAVGAAIFCGGSCAWHILDDPPREVRSRDR